jgi:hypothetical protein
VSQKVSGRFYAMGQNLIGSGAARRYYYAVGGTSFQSLPELQADVARQSSRQGLPGHSPGSRPRPPSTTWWSSPTLSGVDVPDRCPLVWPRAPARSKARYVLENEFWPAFPCRTSAITV